MTALESSRGRWALAAKIASAREGAEKIADDRATPAATKALAEKVTAVMNDPRHWQQIEDRAVECFRCRRQPARDATVRGARPRITARVIVGKDDRRSVREKGCLEHFARLCCGRSYVG